MKMVIVELHARMPVVMEWAADHPVAADAQPEVFRRHFRRDRGFDGFKIVIGISPFDFSDKFSLSSEYTEKKS